MLDKNHLENRVSATKLSVKYLYWITFTMIVTSSFSHYMNGVYGGDLEGISHKVYWLNLIIFTIIYLIGLRGSLYLSKKLSYIKLSKYSFIIKNRFLFYLLSLVFSVLVLFIAILGGVGTIHRNIDTNRYADLFFALFDPYILLTLIIYFFYLNIRKKTCDLITFFILFSIYLFLIIRSGFTGFLIFLLPILFSILLRITSRKIAILTLCFSVALFPFIRIGKWIIGSGLKLKDVDFEIIQIATRGVVERFSAVPNMVYINESLLNKNIFLQSNYLPFFQGYIGSFFHKFFYSEPVSLNTLLLHQTIQDTDSDSNSTFPIISYFSLDFNIGLLSILYTLILIFTLSCLLNFIFGKSNLGRNLISFFLFYVIFFYAFNGWLWALWGVIQATLLFFFFLLIIGKLRAHY